MDRDIGANHRDRPLGGAGAGPDRQLDVRAGLAADPAGDLVDRPTFRRPPVDRDDDVARCDAGRLGRTAIEDTDDPRQTGVVGLDPHADADVRAGQRVVALLALLGRHEVRVPGVADGLGQAFDRPVDEGTIVEGVATDELLVEGVPRLLDEAEFGGLQGGSRVRGRLSQGARRRHQTTDPDPGSERHDQREDDDGADGRPPATATSRRWRQSLGGTRRERSRRAALDPGSAGSGSGQCPSVASCSFGWGARPRRPRGAGRLSGRRKDAPDRLRTGRRMVKVRSRCARLGLILLIDSEIGPTTDAACSDHRTRTTTARSRRTPRPRASCHRASVSRAILTAIRVIDLIARLERGRPVRLATSRTG